MSDAPSPDDAARRAGTDQRTAFERFFPGPAARDPRVAERLEHVARMRRRQSDAQQGAGQHGAGQPKPGRTDAPTSTPTELARLIDAVADQTEVLNALLDADIAIRDDARATAQNSRTFAIAGIVIAFFTMIAAVVTVIVAIPR